MTPFIAVCSYVSMLSLSVMIFLLVLYRVWRAQGKDNRAIGFFIIVCMALFLIGVVLIGIFYR